MDCLQCSSCSLASFFFRFQLALETITQTAHNNINKSCVAAELFVNSAKRLIAGRSKKMDMKYLTYLHFLRYFWMLLLEKLQGTLESKKSVRKKCITHNVVFLVISSMIIN